MVKVLVVEDDKSTRLLLKAVLEHNISLKPVNRMIDKLNALAAGDFKTRLRFGDPIKTHPTFVELSDSFNLLAEELEHTEMLRSDFVNNFSHEFKTPIVSIAGFAKLLRRGNLAEEQQREYLSIIEEESMRLATMATNTLHLTKIENQTILTDVSQFNLSEQIRSCVLLLEHQWSKKKLSLDLDFEEYDIWANEELLKQVWINLLENAIKFSVPTGELLVKIVALEQEYSIAITNFGSEIPLEKQGRIFDKYYQAEESHASTGNGVGLAIVKKVVDLHNGKVFVDSREDKTTFEVTIPRKI